MPTLSPAGQIDSSRSICLSVSNVLLLWPTLDTVEEFHLLTFQHLIPSELASFSSFQHNLGGKMYRVIMFSSVVFMLDSFLVKNS